jgi:hypothetical protein
MTSLVYDATTSFTLLKGEDGYHRCKPNTQSQGKAAQTGSSRDNMPANMAYTRFKSSFIGLYKWWMGRRTGKKTEKTQHSGTEALTKPRQLAGNEGASTHETCHREGLGSTALPTANRQNDGRLSHSRKNPVKETERKAFTKCNIP